MKTISEIIFSDYSAENKIFSKRISRNFEIIQGLASEHEHAQYIEALEREFAGYNGSQYAVAVNSGTTALELALQACGVSENDEVILPTHTYISTGLAVSHLNAIPIFADIKKSTLTIDPADVAKKVTKRTKAIIPVHIHGNPCDMDRIMSIAHENKLQVVEDCSHAHGATYREKRVGNFGIGCFSCHTSKVFSGMGNSGFITTDEVRIYNAIKKSMNVENETKFALSHRVPCGMDVTQAAVLSAKLPFLDQLIDRRRKLAAIYLKNLPEGVVGQTEEKNSRHVYRDFVILAEDRDDLKNYLQSNHVETKIRYKIPLHLSPFFRSGSASPGALPVAEGLYGRLLWLPVSHALTAGHIEPICHLINDHAYAKSKS